MREKLAKLIAVATAVLLIIVAMIIGRHQQGRIEQLGQQVDPQAWAELFPLHYQSFMRSVQGSADEPYDKLAANPFRKRAWAGYAFELEYNQTRAHYYAQIDQRESRRTLEREQPAGCINCHAAETPQLISDYGWGPLHAMSYAEVRDKVHFGSSCLDCHKAETMALRISRPAFINAMTARGIDISKASRQDMRSYVCAQCHVEYYFQQPDNQLTLPWTEGLRLEQIESHFNTVGHDDWIHAETGAAMIKIQHPEFEFYSRGIHAAEGVACADCHMPLVRERGMQISEHWIRSPMTQLETACMGCHTGNTGELAGRVVAIQQNTRALLANAETAITNLIEAIIAARNNGATDTELAAARLAHRRAQLRWDFIDAENSTGFHAAHEATRILADAVEIARSSERSVQSLLIEK